MNMNFDEGRIAIQSNSLAKSGSRSGLNRKGSRSEFSELT